MLSLCDSRSWKSSIIVVPHRSMNSGLEKEVPVAAKLETNLDKVVTEFFRYRCSLFGYDGVFVHADDVSLIRFDGVDS